MQPKTCWAIVLLLLIVAATFAAISVMQTVAFRVVGPAIEGVDALAYIQLIALLVTVVALVFFALKHKIGFYLSLVISLYPIVSGIINIVNFLLQTTTIAIDVASLTLAFGLATLFCTWKSKPVFETKK